MKAFISYAAEQFELAQELAQRLKSNGVKVFFDRDRLLPGDAFDASIRQAIDKTDLFIFLASADSLRTGNYTLTELGFAEQRWPNATGRVLTILVDDTQLSSLPAYLRSVSVLQPRGDPVAETVAVVDRMARRRRRVRRASYAVLAVALLLSLVLWRINIQPVSPFLLKLVSVTKTGDDYHFKAELRNTSDRHISSMRLFPETDREGVYFSSSTESIQLAPGAQGSQVVKAQLKRPGSESFNWRLCWVVVNTYELDRAEGKMSIYQFIDEHGKMVCSRYRPWPD